MDKSKQVQERVIPPFELDQYVEIDIRQAYDILEQCDRKISEWLYRNEEEIEKIAPDDGDPLGDWSYNETILEDIGHATDLLHRIVKGKTWRPVDGEISLTRSTRRDGVWISKEMP